MQEKILERLVCTWMGKQGPDSLRRAKSSRKIISFYFKKGAGQPHDICVQPGWQGDFINKDNCGWTVWGIKKQDFLSGSIRKIYPPWNDSASL